MLILKSLIEIILQLQETKNFRKQTWSFMTDFWQNLSHDATSNVVSSCPIK